MLTHPSIHSFIHQSLPNISSMPCPGIRVVISKANQSRAPALGELTHDSVTDMIGWERPTPEVHAMPWDHRA